MPVFQETANAARDLRILSSKAIPLPRLTPLPKPSSGPIEKLEVVVIGAGPSGLFLTLLLARYGLTGPSLVCFDSKPGTLKAGQADGLQPRTLEVFKSLGIVDEILNDGCHMSEVAFWNAKGEVNGAVPELSNEKRDTGIERTSFAPDVNVAARYQHEVTIHQGRIERILEENLQIYSKDAIRRSHRFVDCFFDDVEDPEYPLVVVVEDNRPDLPVRKTVRAKYLVGADGAHSQVRKKMGLSLTGETTDHIWGVVDFVAETDFPDIRKRCAVHSAAGSVMIIPREKIATGQYLTRLYVQVKDEFDPDDGRDSQTSKQTNCRERRNAITLNYIFDQAQKVFAPYTIQVKDDTVDWWAAYQIGQRMSSKFSKRCSDGVDRIFIVGDACHTHSPKAGQGMNVSMMDSYNLSWKLVHSLHGLTPDTVDGSDPILASFEHERLDVARQLLDFDSKFSNMFSGKMSTTSLPMSDLTHEQFLKVFSDGSGFTSGCGIEYPPSLIVKQLDEQYQDVIQGQDFLNGTLKAGRRFRDARVKRYADANLRHLQDDLQSTGCYRLVFFSATDILDKSGRSAQALEDLCANIIPAFPGGVVELVVLHPIRNRRFEWSDIPKCVKQYSEMRFHGIGLDDPYEVYGVSETEGAVVVVRPDGYVGMIGDLSSTSSIQEFLKGCLKSLVKA